MTAPLMVLSQVTKEYRRREGSIFKRSVFRAVDSLDMVVYPGELLLIKGRSGAGKSTIARLMVGLTAPTFGAITFAGLKLTGAGRPAELAGRRQIVFQNPYRSLSPRLTVGDIVVEPARIIGRAAVAPVLLDLVGLSSRLASRYPAQLSAGQRQRVALARALATSPELLVLDEPTSALDPMAAAEINKTILGLKSKPAVVLISHDSVIAKAADRVLVIEGGRLSS